MDLGLWLTWSVVVSRECNMSLHYNDSNMYMYIYKLHSKTLACLLSLKCYDVIKKHGQKVVQFITMVYVSDLLLNQTDNAIPCAFAIFRVGIPNSISWKNIHVPRKLVTFHNSSSIGFRSNRQNSMSEFINAQNRLVLGSNSLSGNIVIGIFNSPKCDVNPQRPA